jgi:hypothetical protein
MNNSLPRLIEGMVATLRTEVIPRIDGDYARGQAFGVIYMLNSLKLRCSWSNAFLIEQLRIQEDATRALHAIASEIPGAPLPEVAAPAALPVAGALEALRDAGDQRLCDLIDWLAANRASVPADAAARAEGIVNDYLARQAKYEISTSAKPMFVEMSGGAERT